MVLCPEDWQHEVLSCVDEVVKPKTFPHQKNHHVQGLTPNIPQGNRCTLWRHPKVHLCCGPRVYRPRGMLLTTVGRWRSGELHPCHLMRQRQRAVCSVPCDKLAMESGPAQSMPRHSYDPAMGSKAHPALCPGISGPCGMALIWTICSSGSKLATGPGPCHRFLTRHQASKAHWRRRKMSFWLSSCSCISRPPAMLTDYSMFHISEVQSAQNLQCVPWSPSKQTWLTLGMVVTYPAKMQTPGKG